MQALDRLNLVPQPPLHLLPAGHRLPAGLSHATVLPDIDWETYSEAGYVWREETQRWGALPDVAQDQKGLGVVGAMVYSEHPSTEILSLAYDLKDGRGKRHWRPGLPIPADLWAHVLQGGLLEAHNVAFEYWIWANVAHRRMGWPLLRPEKLRCAMGKGRSWGLPGALGKVGEVLGLQTQKDKRGTALLDRFSVPRNPTKTDPRKRIRPLWTLDDVEREVAEYQRWLQSSSSVAI